MQTLSIQVTGKVTASQPASAPNDLVRLAELTTTLLSYSRVGHLHVLAQISDLETNLPGVIAQLTEPTSTFRLAVDPSTGQLSGVVPVVANAGLDVTAGGLALDAAWLSARFLAAGATFTTAQISDLATVQFPLLLAEWLGNSNSF